MGTSWQASRSTVVKLDRTKGTKSSEVTAIFPPSFWHTTLVAIPRKRRSPKNARSCRHSDQTDRQPPSVA